MLKPIWLVLAFSLALSSGCKQGESVTHFADRQLFQRFGMTLSKKPKLTPMKEIHLEVGSLAGQSVLVKGAVVHFGKNETFMVLSDETARLLVVLTGAQIDLPATSKGESTMVQVLGEVESGKKGLPYISARAVNVLRNPKTKA